MRSPEGLPVHIPVQHGRDGEHGSGTGAGAGQDASQQARGEAGVRAFGEQDGVVEVLARGLTVGGVGVQPQQFPGQGELAAGCRDHGGCAAAGARYGGEHGRLGQEFVAGDVPLHRAWGHVVGAPGDDPAHARGVVHRVRPSGVLVGVGGLQDAGYRGQQRGAADPQHRRAAPTTQTRVRRARSTPVVRPEPYTAWPRSVPTGAPRSMPRCPASASIGSTAT